MVPRRGRLAGGLTFALLAFFLLSLAGVSLRWLDAAVRSPGLREGVIGYASCSAVVLVGLLVPGRWRSIPLLLATVGGAVLPVYLVRDLLDLLGTRDVWIGQSLTLSVLFPLLVGGAGTVAILRRPRRDSFDRAWPGAVVDSGCAQRQG